jgi:hypothetical protein
MGFTVYFKPWRVADRGMPNYLGVGAFNFVKRSVYERFGGHKSFAMNVLDDMELGRRVKMARYHSTPAYGHDLISVPWVTGWKGIVKSLEKNGFAGVNYSLGFLSVYTLLAFVVNILPFILFFAADGWTQVLSAGSILFIAACYAAMQRNNPETFIVLPFHPFGVALVFIMIWRSAILALKEGGIRWRDTFYPLHELKKK